MRIDPGDVHLWISSFKSFDLTDAELSLICSVDEITRANRFHFISDRKKFIQGRAFLRLTLARYIGTSSANIRFQYGCFGKPSAESSGGIEFSFSRSGGHAAVAISRQPVGLDIEEIRPAVAVTEVASTFFSTGEQAALAACPRQLRTEAFYRCWVSKEAYVKACGLGLSLPLDQFEVAVDPSGPAGLLRPPAAVPGSEAWSLHAIDALPGYAMALAATTPLGTLRVLGRQDDAEDGARWDRVPAKRPAARGAEMLGRTHILPIGVQP